MLLARSPAGPRGLEAWSACYRAADFFVVRSPILPLERLIAWSNQQPGPGEDRATRLASRLLLEFAAPALREAIFFASPEVERLLAAPGDGAPPDSKLVRTLTRYFMRAAGRETPFGLFAGISFGRITGEARLQLGPEAEQRRQTRVAPSFLNRLLARLELEPVLREQLHYELGSSVSLAQGNFRFVSAEPLAELGSGDANAVVELTATPMLHRVVREAQLAITPAALAQVLLMDELAYADVLEFVLTLCERRFLVASWSPAATGERLLNSLLEQMKLYPALSATAERLEAVQQLLLTADRAVIGTAGQALRGARVALESIAAADSSKQPLLQADLVKPAADLQLSDALAQKFLAAAALLQRVGPAPQLRSLSAFREHFTRRYEQRWVPLLEALDRDIGIGFDSFEGFARDAFLDGIIVPPTPKPGPAFDAYDRARLKVWQRSVTQGELVCELDTELLELFPLPESASLPESFAVLARLARVEGGRLLVVAPILTAPSALNTLGRFGEAEPLLLTALQRLAALEQGLAGDTLLADVAYLPHNDSAQIAVRPVLRHYEIPLLGRSGAPREQQIPLSDLLVSVEGDRVVLFDSMRKKRVKIRIASAHNYGHPACPVSYRFLGALQLQDEGALVAGWSWGPLDDADQQPRVVHRDTVLSVARFRLSSKELKPALAASGSQAFDLVQSLRTERRLPRFLTRPERDQRLPVDLDNELSVSELLHAARRQSSLVLEELLPGPEELVLQGEGGRYCAEFVVPFVRHGSVDLAPRRAPRHSPESEARASERRHAPGSNWLYAKIYAGRSQLEEVVQCVRAGVVEPLFGAAIELWFFLPYADPEPHLRVRFRGNPSALRGRVLPRLSKSLAPLLERGTVWRFQLDTYEQEIERYGGASSMALCEQVFWADSDAVAQLQVLAADSDELRWQLALLGIDRLLIDCGYDLDGRAVFATRAAEDYALEVRADRSTRQSLSEKYRGYADTLGKLLSESQESAPAVLQAAHRIFTQRSERIVPIWAALNAVRTNAALPAGMADLPRSFAHLHALRLLGLGGRSFELVLYDFLRRQYRTRLARQKVNRVPATAAL